MIFFVAADIFRTLRSLQCCQFGDFVAKCSYILILAVTFIDFF